MKDQKNPASGLKKELGFIQLFSIAAGAMISSGLFVLPAIAFAKTGPAVILSYFLASLLVIPAMLTKAELATAMPKSGGTYFFVNRSLGPLLGTFAGFTNWLSLALKSAFALVGIGIFIQPFLPSVETGFFTAEVIIKIIAVVFTLIFTLLNLFSVKESGRMQSILVFILLSILIIYVVFGFPQLDQMRFIPFLAEDKSWNTVISTAGLIFISFGGLTKISSVAAEAKNPGKTIPASMISAFVVVSILYLLAVAVTVGSIAPELLKTTLTPLSDGARVSLGTPGWWILAAAAVTAFITTANAGLMAASRTPFAMAEDKLIPSVFGRISIRYKTPVPAILLTTILMIISILFLDIEKLAKVASAMMLLLFAMDCISVIIMRTSGITTYRPMFKSPLFPFLQIGGILIYAFLIFDMGWLPSIITVSFFLFSIIWYLIYTKRRDKQQSALIHIVEKLTNKKLQSGNLESELREILIERDELIEDRFDRLIQDADIIDIDKEAPEMTESKELFKLLSDKIAIKTGEKAETLLNLFFQREEDSTTVIGDGLAVPHLIYEGKKGFSITIAKSKKGITFQKEHPPVHIIFALAGTKDERNFHLQTLMAIAQIVSNEEFKTAWIKAKSTEEIRNQVRLADRVRRGIL